ncbi:hypothetical protein DFP72DRAFT_840800 [Ephemerocybe angulata]|uniref:Uncharacterized protein n=1 Tax=Ephemerocybe angulata TaxID=980116 RepID=A0A8H6IH05_9AGAR|nr:hypothetical protein DFP72DRAFT_840800 [Tulosesus angulatus]
MDPARKPDGAIGWLKERFNFSPSASRSPAPSHRNFSRAHTLAPTVGLDTAPGNVHEAQANASSRILVAQPRPTLGRAARPPLGIIFSTAGIPCPLNEDQNFNEGASAIGVEAVGPRIDEPTVPPIAVERGPRETPQASGSGEHTIEHPVQNPISTVNPSPDPAQADIGADRQDAGESTEESLGAAYEPQTLRNKVYEGVKTTLRTVVTVTDAFPPLKSTAAALLVICDTFDRYTENPEEFKKLLLRVKLLAKTIESCPSPALFQSLESRFKKMSKDLESIRRTVEEKMAEDRWKISRIILSEQDKREISDLTSQITRLIEETMFEFTIKSGSWTLQIVGEIDWMKGQLNSTLLVNAL